MCELILFVGNFMTKNDRRRPLFLSSSGGGGHISAIRAIIEDHPEQPPMLQIENNWKRNVFLDFILWVVQKFVFIKSFIKFITNLFSLPALPDTTLFQAEIDRLTLTAPYSYNKNELIERQYIDVLLDICDDGFYQCAYWNVFQKQDDVKNLEKLIDFQHYNERRNHQKIKTSILSYLIAAKNKGEPYTEIVSSQPLGISAICDAIDEYHKLYPDLETLKLKQYLTDCPSAGCKHYFHGLQNLSPEHKAKIELYILKSAENYGLDGFDIKSIDFKNNPMVRKAFKTVHSEVFSKDIRVRCSGLENELDIKSNETTACVMLGSNASDATIEYVRSLIELRELDMIFVFTGGNQDLVNLLKQEDNLKLIILAQQGAEAIATLMARSQYTIIRGGGLSIMEQMCLIEGNLNRARQIFIHHKEGASELECTSGIEWEDGNVTYFTETLNAGTNLLIKKTSPQLFPGQIANQKSNKISLFNSLNTVSIIEGENLSPQRSA